MAPTTRQSTRQSTHVKSTRKREAQTKPRSEKKSQSVKDEPIEDASLLAIPASASPAPKSKHATNPRSENKPKPIKDEVIEAASLLSIPKRESSMLKPKRTTKRKTKYSHALARQYRRDQNATGTDLSSSKQSLKEEMMTKEESEGEEPKKGNPVTKSHIYARGEGWWLCRKHRIWIGPDHPLW